jgi:two-component system, NarL family, response regulator NreC
MQLPNDNRIVAASYMPKTILIADDSDTFRRALCQAFTRESDFEVCGEAHDGQDAIDKAQRFHPDLIILDLSMPVMNGLEAARALKQLMPTVPIIMFTFYVEAFVEKEAQLAGVNELVSKSAHISVLVGKARSLLYRSAA